MKKYFHYSCFIILSFNF